jgi:hypothetical protein
VEPPVNECPVNFHISMESHSINLNNCVLKVRPPVGIESARLKHPYRLVAGSLESEAVKVLTAPDVTEEPFMDIEREFTHGVLLCTTEIPRPTTLGREDQEKN